MQSQVLYDCVAGGTPIDLKALLEINSCVGSRESNFVQNPHNFRCRFLRFDDKNLGYFVLAKYGGATTPGTATTGATEIPTLTKITPQDSPKGQKQFSPKLNLFCVKSTGCGSVGCGKKERGSAVSGRAGADRPVANVSSEQCSRSTSRKRQELAPMEQMFVVKKKVFEPRD